MAQPERPEEQRSLPAPRGQGELEISSRELELRRRELDIREREIQVYEKSRRGETRAEIATSALKYGSRFAYPMLFAFMYLAGQFAGKETSLSVSIIAQIGGLLFLFSGWLLSTILATGWFFDHRRLRRVVAEYAARNAELEKRVDPGRDSSNLTPGGDTNPKDEP